MASASIAPQGSPCREGDAEGGRAEPRSLTLDRDVDVCVVGGGLAGLCTAHELAQRGWSVAVLEARTLGWNASGHHAGIVVPGFAASEERLIARVGLDHAREVWSLSRDGVARVGATMGEYATATSWLSVEPGSSDALARRADMIASLGGEVAVLDDSGQPAPIEGPFYRRMLRGGGAQSVDAAGYLMRLADAARALGVTIYENSPVVGFDLAGRRKRVATAVARVRAEHVVLAGNVHLGRLMPRLSATLMPVWSTVIVTEPLPGLADVVRSNDPVTESAGRGTAFRVLAGDRLVWWGGSTPWRPRERAAGRRLAADIRRRFPQLGPVSIAHVASAVSGRTVHNMPQIGELMPGVWVASGFAGHGLNTTAMAGALIAGAIAQRDDRWRLFLPFELVWAGGWGGRIAVQAGTRAVRWRDAASAQVARVRPVRTPPVSEAQQSL